MSRAKRTQRAAATGADAREAQQAHAPGQPAARGEKAMREKEQPKKAAHGVEMPAAHETHKPHGAPGFALKLTLAMLPVLALALSLGGAVLLAGSFSDSLNEAGQQAEAQHLLQCYALESDLLDVAARGETVTESHLAHYGSTLSGYAGGRMAALFCAARETAGGESPDGAADAMRAVYSSFAWDEAPTGSEDTYRMRRAGGRTYLLFETGIRVSGGPAVTLLTGHDVTDVLQARDRALLRFWAMELVVLACAGAVIALLSRWLTRPLARLAQASESIAAGAYGERTGLSGEDEIGALSRSFDAMAAAVEEKVAALELSVRQREDFMAAFSHELKTPMTAVIGFAETLRDVQCKPEEQRRAAGYIYSEARRVEALSQKLLELLGLSGAPPALMPLALSDVCARAQTALAPSIAPVALHIRPAPGVFVLGDGDLLTDLLYNLVWNAVRAKPRDGRVQVDWQPAQDGAKIALTVRDTGCGIPPEVLARVTEPFFMVDKSRARAGGGSGIGLSLCKKIAEAHGSALLLESTPGEGTAVTVLLDAVSPQQAGPGEEAQP